MKKIFTFIFLFILIFNTKISKADAIWSNVASDIAIEVSREVRIQIRIVVNAQAKMMAIKQVQSTIESSLVGASDSPKYIKNYRDFLVTSPYESAQIATNEIFLTAALEGKTSGGGYVSATMTGTEEGISANMTYNDYLKNIGEVAIKGNDEGVKVTIDDICNPLEGLFSQGDWDCFSEIMDNQINLPVGLAVATESYLNQKTEEYQLEAKVMAQSSEGGFLPIIDVNGNVTLPSGITADLQTKIVTLPIDSVANSDSDVFSTLAQALTINTINKITQNGIGEVEKSYRNSSDKFSSRFGVSFTDALEKNGPETNFNMDLLW